MQHNPPDKSGEPVLGSASQAGPSSTANAISYSRDNSTVNQTPSTLLLLDIPSPSPGSDLSRGISPVSGSGPTDLDGVPDVPPPTYEEATGISPNAPAAAPAGLPPLPRRRPDTSANASGQQPQLPPRRPSNSLHVPGAFPRPATSASPGSPTAAAGSRRTSGNAAVADAAGVYGNAKNNRRHSTATGGAGSSGTAGGTSGRTSTSSGRTPAPGSIPRGRQFPAAINLYGDSWARAYTLGTERLSPMYAVRMRPSWEMSNPVIALHNGPNAETAPLLAAVDAVPMSDNMIVTLPPPLTYTGTGSTAVRLDLVLGWSHHYTFTMEVGTATSNVHMEAFEWRHSYGNAIAALGGARDGWKLVRMSTQALPGAPRPNPSPGFVSSDGREVVAMYSSARMSVSKHLKFAFVGTGWSGALGERWSVMAVTSALGIWEKEEAVSNRR